MYKQRNAFYDWSRVPLILDTTQAALCCKSPPTGLHLCKTGQFPAMRVGKAWRLDRDVIRERLTGRPRRRKKDSMEDRTPLDEVTSQEDPRPMYVGGNPIFG